MAAVRLAASPCCFLYRLPDARRRKVVISMTADIGSRGGKQRSSLIKVVVNGAGGELGRAALRAVTGARGMEVAGAVDPDSSLAGRDAGEIAGLEEPLELPVTKDLVMVLASVAQTQDLGVLVDLESKGDAYENIRQAAAFGLKSVISGAILDEDQVETLFKFCEKASMGCVIAPTLSIGTTLLQQAAVTAAFHYPNVDIIEGSDSLEEDSEPSPAALQMADALAGLGRIYNERDLEGKPSGYGGKTVILPEGIRWHGVEKKGQLGSMEVRFGAPGQTLSLRHDVEDVNALMPGLLLAIRRAARLRSLVYGLEKLL